MSVFQYKFSRFTTAVLLLFALFASFNSDAASKAGGSEEFNASEVILHHVMDDHKWHFWDGHYGTLYLPVIVY